MRNPLGGFALHHSFWWVTPFTSFYHPQRPSISQRKGKRRKHQEQIPQHPQPHINPLTIINHHNTHQTYMAMDWFSWLSKTGLDPSLVYEYSHTFTLNELEEEDIAFFDHEFLLYMGISIAKHRLEIMKLSKKESGRGQHPMSRLLGAMKKTRRCITKYINAWLGHKESALMVLPGKAHGMRWRGAKLKRNQSMMLLKREMLMLTDESVMATPPSVVSGPSPLSCDQVNGESRWSTAVEEMRWASMFQDMKPN